MSSIDPSDSTTGPASEPLARAEGDPSARAAAAVAADLRHDDPEGWTREWFKEWIRERRRERRGRWVFRALWTALAICAVWIVWKEEGGMTPVSGPHTALVDVRGEIALESPANAESLVGAIRSALEEPQAEALVLRINSPGGSPVQAGIVHDEILRLKALHQKKVYAVVEEVCASGAYYIAVAADEILVDKASIVGSIGVLMDGFGFSGLMGKLGVERRLLTAGELKGMLDPFSPEKPAERAIAQSLLDQIHRQFITVVREGRGDRLKTAPDTFSGRYWTGEDAVAQGLADRYGSLDMVARDLVQAPDIIDYTAHENVAERLVKRFGAAIGDGAVQALRRLPQLH
jgi:protease IV